METERPEPVESEGEQTQPISNRSSRSPSLANSGVSDPEGVYSGFQTQEDDRDTASQGGPSEAEMERAAQYLASIPKPGSTVPLAGVPALQQPVSVQQIQQPVPSAPAPAPRVIERPPSRAEVAQAAAQALVQEVRRQGKAVSKRSIAIAKKKIEYENEDMRSEAVTNANKMNRFRDRYGKSYRQFPFKRHYDADLMDPAMIKRDLDDFKKILNSQGGDVVVKDLFAQFWTFASGAASKLKPGAPVKRVPGDVQDFIDEGGIDDEAIQLSIEFMEYLSLGAFQRAMFKTGKVAYNAVRVEMAQSRDGGMPTQRRTAGL